MSIVAFHEERRQSARRAVNFKVQHRNPRTEKVVFDFARDLSATGLFLRTNRVRPVGCELELRFPVDDLVSRAMPIRVIGVVTRVAPEGIAVRFKLDDPSVLPTLNRLLGR